jgi:hypothetical protein
MRLSGGEKMKTRWIFPILAVIFLVSFFAPGVLAGDTGTYGIKEYRVTLIPHSNGEIEIAYEQEWIVKSGHIPWVTVGTPNSDYSIKSFGGAAKSVKPDNGGGWSGVRVDLDRDYQPQEKIRFNFTIVQNKLLEKADAGYRLRFTPGWYDRAVTDDLTIKLISPAKVEGLKTDPKPSSISGQEVTWNKKNLGNGEKFPISVSFPNGTYNQTLLEKSGQSGGSDGFLLIVIIGVFLFIAFVLFIGSASSSDDGSDYGGSYSSSESIRRRRKKDDDDYISPVIVSGSSRGSSDHSSSSHSGRGGGFGGRSTSCACACVSCACACACAGGGGAGCTKKFRHSCPKCSGKVEDEKDKGAI